uniref:Restriction system protein n=1 Tax=Candidatus Kentrum sp. UNK TaxID=2126344 RepID=A0A451A4L9_9GAMM|nr:MAG: restriction system protein [Candidatus Kentron sp. UNK]VFK69507.1 MAG: restriction system protein [Candidatus Kentron sp. UNK]
MTKTNEYVVRTPLFPNYNEVRQLLRVWNGTARSDVLAMIRAISNQTGTPQNSVDWTDPDEWIDARLTESSRELARRIWTESKKTVNPRHTYGAHLLVNSYALLSADQDGIYRVTETGKKFLSEDPNVVRAIDLAEGLPQLLSILVTRSPAKRGDLLEDWRTFLLEHSRLRSTSTINEALRRRIQNLVQRSYIDREGITYTITEKGIGYAAEAGTETALANQTRQQVLDSLKAHNEDQTWQLRDRLGQMEPYRFESLIKDLLEAMDYEDVEVTKQSGDKGIDVVANYQFGITQIKEVVQVKRQQGAITRPILDQLRGALPYQQAIRGTIITLGKFTEGCREAALFPGAAPITLIDGDKLIELLLKHDVGVKKRRLSLIEVDESYFQEIDPEGGI